MVRAGAVPHPGEWRHGGCPELLGDRQRYRIVNQVQLRRCLGHPEDADGFQRWYEATLADKLAATYHVRESCWSEALAVGSPTWLAGVLDRFGYKRKRILPVGEGSTPQLDLGEESHPWYIEG